MACRFRDLTEATVYPIMSIFHMWPGAFHQGPSGNHARLPECWVSSMSKWIDDRGQGHAQVDRWPWSRTCQMKSRIGQGNAQVWGQGHAQMEREPRSRTCPSGLHFCFPLRKRSAQSLMPSQERRKACLLGKDAWKVWAQWFSENL